MSKRASKAQEAPAQAGAVKESLGAEVAAETLGAEAAPEPEEAATSRADSNGDGTADADQGSAAAEASAYVAAWPIEHDGRVYEAGADLGDIPAAALAELQRVGAAVLASE